MIERIGPYRLLREIGHGGMGTVYVAERDADFTQRVAIKVIAGIADAAALRRFAAERRILADLEHPGIARLLDGGTTAAGVPYLVMELVDGVPIDRYCETLSIPARVDVFLAVCAAVSHAHRRLVVHRDLKPSNILVTAGGAPKLLDFGIATPVGEDAAGTLAAGPATGHGLTAQYASPEQIRGDRTTTAADVYALGVLLYEVLAGRRPYDVEGRAPEDIERLVCRDEPPRPRIGGDFDTVVMKALRKEPAERYASVDALAEDLRRCRDGLPVAARPATWAYVARRLARRHPRRVAAAAALALTVTGFAAALAWSAARARHERDTAERVTSALIQMFGGSDLRSPQGDTITVRELLDRGAAALNRDPGDRTDVRVRLLAAVDRVSDGLGLRSPAEPAGREPVPWTGEDVIDSPPAARALWRLAESLRARGQLAAAEAAARRSLAMSRRLFGSHNPQVGEALDTLGRIVYARGRRAEAEGLFGEMAAVFRDAFGPTHAMVGTALHRLAVSRRDAGDLDDAESLLREAVAIRRSVYSQSAWQNDVLLADVLYRAGRGDEAERRLRAAIEILRAERHPRLTDAERLLAAHHQAAGSETR